jgi:hypothetical protein
MDYDTANSVVRPPTAPTYSVTPTNSVQVNWTTPLFGVVQTYTISRSVLDSLGNVVSGPTVIGSVSGTGGVAPETTFTDTTPPNPPSGGSLHYTIATTLVPDTTGSTPRSSAPSVPAVLAVNQTIVLGQLPSSVSITNSTLTVTATAMSNNSPNMQLVSFSATGPCSVGASSLDTGTGISSAITTLNSTGNCTITASQPGDSTTVLTGTAYSAAPSASGTFTILPQGSTTQSQTIAFPTLANVVYGGTFSISASSSAGLPVGLSASGPCTIGGATTGAGLCKITASAAAGTVSGVNYSAASVTQSFAITTAPLTVTANPATIGYGQSIPGFTSTFGPLVNGDSLTTAVSGTPALSTTATSSSNVGPYPITVSTGSLAAANYAFVFVPGTLTIQTVSPTVSWSMAPPASAAYGSQFTVMATSNSTGTITYSTSGGCTNNLGVVTMTSGTNACLVSASVAAAGNYTTGSVGPTSVSATLAAPAVSWTTAPPASAAYGSHFTVQATSNSTGTITYSTSGGCTISLGLVTMNSGTTACLVSASVAAAGNYTTGSVGPTSVSATLAAPAVSWTSAPPASAAYGSHFTVLATSNSTGTITYGTSGGCTNSLGVVTMTSGTTACLVSASVAAAGNYTTGSVGPTSVTASLATQTITFTTNAPSSAAYGASFTVAATASSGLPVAFTNSGTGACSSNGTTYTMTSSTGTCSVIANQAGNTNYAAAPTVTQTVAASGSAITVSPSTINYGAVNLDSITIKTVTVTNTGNAAATISTPLISLLKAGNLDEFVVVNLCPSSLAAGKSCTITVTFVAGAYYSAPQTATLKIMDSAPSSPQLVALSATVLEPQTITFTTSPPASAAYNTSFTVAATASSGLAVTFSSSGPCSNSGATYTITNGSGTCSVIANQAGNSTWAAAPQVTKNATATLAAQTISFSTTPPSSATYKSSFTVVASGGASGNAVLFTSSGACTNSGATYTISAATGTCSVIANQAGNSDYSAAPQVTKSVTATVAAQTVTFTTNPPASAAYKSSFAVAASASSGLAVAFTSSGACSNSGATYTMTNGTGTCSVIASQAGNSNYSAAPQLTKSVAATQAAQTITFTTGAPATAAYKTSFTVATTGGASGNAVTYTSSGACSNSGATYTMTSGSGSCSVIANQAGNSNYSAATQVTQTVTATYSTASLTPTSLSFGTVASGKSSAAQTATLTNTGTTPLVISSIAFTGTNPGNFTQTTTCPSSSSSLAAGKNCTISVTFKSGGAAASASLTVTDNTQAGTQSVSLSGN